MFHENVVENCCFLACLVLRWLIFVVGTISRFKQVIVDVLYWELFMYGVILFCFKSKIVPGRDSLFSIILSSLRMIVFFTFS